MQVLSLVNVCGVMGMDIIRGQGMMESITQIHVHIVEEQAEADNMMLCLYFGLI